jgi:hypothetical protein
LIQTRYKPANLLREVGFFLARPAVSLIGGMPSTGQEGKSQHVIAKDNYIDAGKSAQLTDVTDLDALRPAVNKNPAKVS